MYFALFGKNYKISVEEFEILKPEGLKRIDGNFVMFKSAQIEKISTLGGVIKRGKYIDLQDVGADLNGVNLIGTNSNQLGSYLKKTYFIKRFKQYDVTKTDLDVKNEGKEIIHFTDRLDLDAKVGVVMGYQHINIYEVIDYDKKLRSMQIGMMPAKLTNMLLNIGIKEYNNKFGKLDNYTIFDPFCGTGTTMMIANYFNYNFLGSDINISPSKVNQKWWELTNFFKKEPFITLFKHDVTFPFEKKFIKNANVIVTEGWLGPIVNQTNKNISLDKNLSQISEVYKGFLNNCKSYFSKIVIVTTLPTYSNYENYWKEFMQNNFSDLEYRFVDEIYKRKGQNVGRQILIVSLS